MVSKKVRTGKAKVQATPTAAPTKPTGEFAPKLTPENMTEHECDILADAINDGMIEGHEGMRVTRQGRGNADKYIYTDREARRLIEAPGLLKLVRHEIYPTGREFDLYRATKKGEKFYWKTMTVMIAKEEAGIIPPLWPDVVVPAMGKRPALPPHPTYDDLAADERIILDVHRTVDNAVQRSLAAKSGPSPESIEAAQTILSLPEESMKSMLDLLQIWYVETNFTDEPEITLPTPDEVLHGKSATAVWYRRQPAYIQATFMQSLLAEGAMQ